jgi:nucleoside 2-deoxyribosyltransferase
MRKEPTDNYINFALLGNNIYDINFMNYLFESQNVNSYYCNKYKICDDKQGNLLKSIAYYFGTRGPILINDKGLRKIFDDNEIPKISILPNLSSDDIINLIDVCLKCDAVYVCNSNGKLDKYTMFILGYLMAMEQEIFFWNDIDESEWLMSCISKKNNKGYKEVVQFPLEIIRTFAYPYLLKKEKLELQPGKYGEVIVDDYGNIGVDRNIEFNLQVENQETEKNTISLLGSLRKQLMSIKEKALQLEEKGYKVLAPKLSNVKTDEKGFIIFEDDVSDNPIIIESDFIENCLKSEGIIVCNKDGYVGNTVMFEIGYLLAKKKNIEFIEEPKEQWLRDVVDYFSKLNDKLHLSKYK